MQTVSTLFFQPVAYVYIYIVTSVITFCFIVIIIIMIIIRGDQPSVAHTRYACTAYVKRFETYTVFHTRIEIRKDKIQIATA